MVFNLFIGILSFVVLHVSMLVIFGATNITLIIVAAVYIYLMNPSRITTAVMFACCYMIWFEKNKEYMTFM